jgi:hypothetical protein
VLLPAALLGLLLDTAVLEFEVCPLYTLRAAWWTLVAQWPW